MLTSHFKTCCITTPRTRESIRKDTYELRKTLGLLSEPYFDIMTIIEQGLPLIDPDFYLEVVSDDQMGNVLAYSTPELHTIRVKESVYDGACLGHHWHRMTMAHEFGHYIYHTPSQVRLTRVSAGSRIPRECDPEIQADIFAAELLMPINLIKGMDSREIAQKCGVSFRAAENQFQRLSKLKKNKKEKTRLKNQSGRC